MLDDIVDRYGHVISNVCHQVEREFASRQTDRGFGFTVSEAGDIEARLYLNLSETGVTAEDLDQKDSPEAVLPQYARNAARREQEFRFRKARVGGLGTIPFEPMTLQLLAVSQSSWGERSSAETNSEAERVVWAMADQVSESYRYATVGYYLRGLDVATIAREVDKGVEAVRKAIQKGRRFMTPEEDSALRAWRRAMFPDVKAPRHTDVPPTQLLDLFGR